MHHLRKYRLDAHMNQASLAKKAQLSVSKIRDWENGYTNITVAELRKISIALEIPIAELLPEEIETPPKFVIQRSGVLKAYKSALSLQKLVTCQDGEMLIARLKAALVQAMPELENAHTRRELVSAWRDSRPDPSRPGLVALNLVDASLFFGDQDACNSQMALS